MKIPSYKYKFKQIFKKIGQPKIIFFDRADVAGNIGRTEKTVFARWAYQNNGQRLRISGLADF
jgi:hypothetical protein